MPVVLDDTDARAADQLLGITATTDGVDASVAVVARRRRALGSSRPPPPISEGLIRGSS